MIRVEMKDGRVFEGELWYFRPQEGWFSLVIDEQSYPNAPLRFILKDVASAVDAEVRTGVLRDGEGKVIAPKVERVDLIERARQEGWDETEQKKKRRKK